MAWKISDFRSWMRGAEELVRKVEKSFERAGGGHEKAPAGLLPGPRGTVAMAD
jgi:hypothetical protein